MLCLKVNQGRAKSTKDRDRGQNDGGIAMLCCYEDVDFRYDKRHAIFAQSRARVAAIVLLVFVFGLVPFGHSGEATAAGVCMARQASTSVGRDRLAGPGLARRVVVVARWPSAVQQSSLLCSWPVRALTKTSLPLAAVGEASVPMTPVARESLEQPR
jgi:hypothetical protein